LDPPRWWWLLAAWVVLTLSATALALFIVWSFLALTR
jgi:hypothetical protein